MKGCLPYLLGDGRDIGLAACSFRLLFFTLSNLGGAIALGIVANRICCVVFAVWVVQFSFGLQGSIALFLVLQVLAANLKAFYI